jgi:HlyD family secretion protein
MASSSSSRTLTIAGGLAVALLVLAGLAWSLGWVGGGESGLSVDVARAETRDVTQVVTAFGRAQPEVEVTISPDVSGEIVELPVQEGDPVQKGDLLARLNPENYRAQVERAEAQVSEARASISERRADSLQARLSYERKKGLYESDAISESEFEQARTAYRQAVARLEAARYRVESARANLRDAEERLAKTRIYAPMSGTVSKLNVESGERVVGTERVQGTEMMKIARLDQMELEVDVNENDVVNVAMDDSASIEIDAYPEETIRGRVTQIANSARVSGQGTQDQVTNFPVKVRVMETHNQAMRAAVGAGSDGVERPEVPGTPEPSLVLRPGMSGTVDIYTETAEEAVAVPIQAVTVRDFADLPGRSASGGEAGGEAGADDGGDSSGGGAGRPEEDLRKVVFVAAADTARMVEVTTGIADETHIVVRSGLDAGERVIVGPYSAVSRELEPGDRIRTGSGQEGGGGLLAGGL